MGKRFGDDHGRAVRRGPGMPASMRLPSLLDAYTLDDDDTALDAAIDAAFGPEFEEC